MTEMIRIKNIAQNIVIATAFGETFSETFIGAHWIIARECELSLQENNEIDPIALVALNETRRLDESAPQH
ncbi:hypothetical protein [Hyphomicrobium facile]|uniref:hypothetical protein n=1 Tax=Hyphomicrobium facile TaxID=51670 RepID=UPI0011607828|nr:hypothetical protein [Hyphomicrobium facile]